MARIVLNPFGSFGDLHPFLAIAIELRRRGHDAVLATSETYRSKIVAEGVAFAPVRPDLSALAADEKLVERIWDPRRGPEYLLKDVLIPNTRAAFEDLSKAIEKADLLVTHSAAYAGPIAAQYFRIPWLSVALQPMVFFSAYDPPLFPAALWLRHFHQHKPWAFRMTRMLMRLQLDSWMKPIYQLRASLGLPPGANSALDGQFSPYGTLALFSKHFAQPQPDWPSHTTATGFVYYDQLGEGVSHYDADNRTRALEDFLDAGPPPVVFTLGSSAVMQAGRFFAESIAAAVKMGVRAVVLIGPQRKMIGENIPPSIFIAEYAPYSLVLPRAAATVHQGGIGTTAQALRSGRPMLIVPWAHDQSDNAEHARRLGVARILSRSAYTHTRVEAQLSVLLNDAAYAQASAGLRAKLLQEDGLQAAADRIEHVLRSAPAANSLST